MDTQETLVRFSLNRDMLYAAGLIGKRDMVQQLYETPGPSLAALIIEIDERWP